MVSFIQNTLFLHDYHIWLEYSCISLVLYSMYEQVFSF